MKAIIPVAGTGAKLRPHTYTQPKALMPLAGKTILGYIIDRLKAAGITEFVFIIGYLGEKIQEYVTTSYPEVTSHFVLQKDRNGIAHAILMVEQIVGEDQILIALGDTICDFDIENVLHKQGNFIGIMKVEDPRRFGIVEMNENGEITKLVEKPSIPKSNKALVGVYKIQDTQTLFECIKQLIERNITENKEYSLTDALELMREKESLLIPFKVKYWYDCGRKDSIIATNALLLERFGGKVHTSVAQNNTIIIPPVDIAAGCIIENSIIGPNVSIGENTRVSHSVIKDSIINTYATLYEIVIDNSIIGSDASVKGMSRSLNIGDNTEIDFG
ncbi:sugar phosphate nucleotidyltransferase [Rhizosphaericola mali]|uniref:NTP transferase domain-containing protein n=1 Tax=Rhizosphaericola mali TaxID=2545455 RepID=A0A5P2G4S8_9BACT|nr:sugar phosphate nucleotidyltransferase [Rhizosphaericola mali]QES90826.1 NTP transferase domain-containing protein [Rhizosphaericola mali]